MSKAIVLGAVAATGVVAATVPTAIMYGGGSKPSTGPFIPQLTSASDIIKDNKYQEVECLKSYFGTITFNATSNGKLESKHIDNFSSNSKSCLIVEYNKKIYSGGKWHGEFRLIWAVKNDTDGQGIITVTNARTDQGGMKGNSAAYVLKKNGSDNTWTTPHKQEIHVTPKRGDDFNNLIPQKAESMPGSISTGKHWGFDADLQKICKDGECMETETQTIHNSYSWEFTVSNEGSEVYLWTSKANEWLEKILAWQELKNKMNTVKGKWQVNRTLTR